MYVDLWRDIDRDPATVLIEAIADALAGEEGVWKRIGGASRSVENVSAGSVLSISVKGPDGDDVIIVGCGPAGLTLAAQLAAIPDISVRLLERRDGPLEVGQADGIACRSMEMFDAFGFAEKVRAEAYGVN